MRGERGRKEGNGFIGFVKLSQHCATEKSRLAAISMRKEKEQHASERGNV